MLISISQDSNAKYLPHWATHYFFKGTWQEQLILHSRSKITSKIDRDYFYHWIVNVEVLSCLPFEPHHMLDVEPRHLVVKQSKNHKLVNRTNTQYALTSLVEAEQEQCFALALV